MIFSQLLLFLYTLIILHIILSIVDDIIEHLSCSLISPLFTLPMNKAKQIEAS